ncbi:hypothetical protein PVK06_028329 [Gossypium arboreum]|uniref:Uncharacterized protein n=1 Tax=Gossypium arboreum TaxID=29729 RepID=A0ABR0P2N6_GOSAR|nr:hypothetical protein PVK06_028329 [Gossypium arboreum]
MYTETKNNKKLKQLYQKALAVKSTIPHPRIMGIIRECGGKMHMAECQWAEAATIWEASFSCPSWFSSGARNLIKRILDPSSLTRITIPEILQDEWFKKGYKPPKFEQDEDF